MKLIYLFLFITLTNCCETEQNSILVNKITKNYNSLIMEIHNNSNEDYYILDPQLLIYIKDETYMVETKLISPFIESEEIDEKICEVYPLTCKIYEKEIFGKIVKLPKKSKINLIYQYFEYYDENEAKYEPLFPYNLPPLQEEQTNKTKKLIQLLDSINIIENYSFYSNEVQIGNVPNLVIDKKRNR